MEHLTQSHQAQRALIGQEPVSLHIITAKFATKKNNINLAPTNNAKEKIEDFYKQLQAVLDRGRNKDIIVLMGDVNGKIGSDNTGHEEIMGTQGLGKMNENGERFIDLDALNS